MTDGAVHLGLLVPRYGVEVLGGTEHWLRALCEHLVAERGWRVDVFTTCAVSAATWADEYRPGRAEIRGVAVHRHRSLSGRNPEYLATHARFHRAPRSLHPEEARRYVDLVGPVCPDAVDQAVGSRCDLVAVTPYLYWPTVTGVPRLGLRTLFHGAAHDEPELYMPFMPAVFRSVGGFAFNSFSERDLVERTFAVGHIPSRVIGNAVDEGEGSPQAARLALGLGPEEPFVLSVGRVERSKGVAALVQMWQLYRQRRPGAPKLVVVGPVHDHLPSVEGVVVAGSQPEAVKWGALRACSLLAAPSAQESFSLVVIESWLAGHPVLVNGRCGPTVEHCRRSGGGLWYSEYADFEAAVDRLLGDPGLALSLARAGERYAREAFAWGAVLDRYEELAGRVLARRRAQVA